LKSIKQKKVLGLSLGEKSLLAAEVMAGPRPQVLHVAEMVYPEGISANEPAQLAPLLAAFLAEHGFAARQVIVGIPARWIVVKPKEVPPTDEATLIQLLRLQAEAEFSTELKDLVYDFAADTRQGAAKSVMLMATPKKYVDAAMALCDGAKLKALAVMPSALALGEATGDAMNKEVLVLAVGPGGSELSAHRGGSSGAIRHLRPPTPPGPFLNELRRAVSTLPATAPDREMILWGSGMDASALGEQLGFQVRSGDLPSLGVDSAQNGSNGDGRKYAPAVALAMVGILDRAPTVDFLHSRLAPPKEQRFGKWAQWAAYAGGAVVLIVIIAWIYSSYQQSQLDKLNATLNAEKDDIATAKDFVGMVSTAQQWHGTDARYLAAMRNLTQAIPDDGQTYATSLTITEITRSSVVASGSGKTAEIGALSCQFFGKTSDQQHARLLVDRISATQGFSDVNLGGTQDAGRGSETSFSITFNYSPVKTGP
jgi:hypothetical protein